MLIANKITLNLAISIANLFVAPLEINTKPSTDDYLVIIRVQVMQETQGCRLTFSPTFAISRIPFLQYSNRLKI